MYYTSDCPTLKKKILSPCNNSDVCNTSDNILIIQPNTCWNQMKMIGYINTNIVNLTIYFIIFTNVRYLHWQNFTIRLIYTFDLIIISSGRAIEFHVLVSSDCIELGKMTACGVWACNSLISFLCNCSSSLIASAILDNILGLLLSLYFLVIKL